MKYESNKKLETSFPSNFGLRFRLVLKQINTKGKIVFEYNPFRNFRIEKERYEYNNTFYTLEELKSNYNLSDSEIENIPKFEKGMLIDFETEHLNFDLEHPVNIVCQPSYDGSVNLILDDNKNIPRLINSRFSQTGFNTYEVVDRKGSNDTNIYDEGNDFNIDTSLYKRVTNIPELSFKGVYNGGNLKVGNYNFYFKLADADGNETDFVAESGIVSVYIGSVSDPFAIRGGIRDENANKSVSFSLHDIDTAYDYITVYYTRNTSDVDGNIITEARKINRKYLVTGRSSILTIDGFEEVQEISVDDINIQYQIVDSALSQAECQNRLFLANINKPKIDYKELTDLSLRVTSEICRDADIGNIDENYDDIETIDKTRHHMYYNPYNIYYRVGYWNHEIYRFGIVFILHDNTLSPVFNIRGHSKLNSNMDDQWTDIQLYNKEQRNYITYDENSYKLFTDTDNSILSEYENAKGVIAFNEKNIKDDTVLGIKFSIKPDVIEEMEKYAKGVFFVRQKRIPNILGQGLAIGKERISSTPVIPVDANQYSDFINSQEKGEKNGKKLNDYDNNCYISERFLDNDRLLTHDFEERLFFLNNKDVDNRAMICPEWEIRQKDYNNLFTGSNFVLKESDVSPANKYFNTNRKNNRHFYINAYTSTDSYDQRKASLTAVPDNTKYVVHNDEKYSTRAGDAEEAFRFKYLRDKQGDNKEASNIIRGSYGPVLGTSELTNMMLYDIYVPDYNEQNLDNYFSIRYEDESPFYPVGDRIVLDSIKEPIPQFRGDCYICNYTHRVVRNFQDLTAPNNDQIVDPKNWQKHYDVKDLEKLEKINRGDVNAIQIGHWVTFKVRSTYNLSLRDTDKSYPSEQGLTGLNRGFYPLQPMSVEGNYKIPESFYMNGGHTTSVSNKYNMLLPDVPYIKNRFNTRIIYSNIHINDAFENGYRVFKFNQYKDYPKTYGSITKIVEMFGNLVCVFEHGVALIPVNERVQTASPQGGDVFINTSKVLPDNPRILSDMFGSQWSDSVIKTPMGIYGVDTVGRKIWYTNGREFKIISDFKCQQFLNQNITLKERDLTPIIGIRNVKTHYNAFKNDVMFTFYDNLFGIQETVWNLTWNELLQKWITFYSWIPSFMSNIDNIPFSFNRDTSKWISKLGISSKDNKLSQGIVLDEVIWDKNNLSSKLDLKNRPTPELKGIELPNVQFNFKVERDSNDTFTYFEIENNQLKFKGDYETFISKPCWLVNVSCNLIIEDYTGTDMNIKQYLAGWKTFLEYNAAMYKNTLAVTSKDVYYNKLLTDEDKTKPNLSTDFWKHGQSGIIDIKDKIKPTFWYGEQHPFEFEFVVAADAGVQKIFNNLEIISNAAEPESFHYKITGDGYDFSKEKETMFIRQELAKQFYQFNGSSIEFDRRYLDMTGSQTKINDEIAVKSTVFPLLYYGRVKNPNMIKDQYYGYDKDGYNYSSLTGTEIIYDQTRNEYGLWVHSEAVNIEDPKNGRLRGNINYQEDCFDVQISSIIFVQRNEKLWDKGNNISGHPQLKVPISIYHIPYVQDIKPFPIDVNTLPEEYLPESLTKRGYGFDDIDLTNWSSPRKETKIRDKYIKIRIRYKGDKLAIITAIKTLYTISYA